MDSFIYFIIDQSGSMMGRQDSVVSGLKEFLTSDRWLENTLFSLYSFNEKLHILFEERSSKDIVLENYKPRGTTALYDAMYQVLDKMKQKLESIESKDAKFVMIVFTDGEENSSTMYSKNDVNSMIEKLVPRFEIVFVGSNQDAVLSGSTIGISRNSCLQYNDECFTRAMHVTREAVQRYQSNETQTVEFNCAERSASAPTAF